MFTPVEESDDEATIDKEERDMEMVREIQSLSPNFELHVQLTYHVPPYTAYISRTPIHSLHITYPHQLILWY